jgi:hypothetical protein
MGHGRRKHLRQTLVERRRGMVPRHYVQEAGTFGPASAVRVLLRNGAEVPDGEVVPPPTKSLRQSRQKPRERALQIIAARGRNGATGLEIGMAVGSHRRMSRSAMELVGVEIGARLVAEGVVMVTRGNRFVLVQIAHQAIAPATEVYDMPWPGFKRVKR